LGAVSAFLAGMLAFSCALAQDKPAAGKLDFVEGDALVESKDAQPRIAKAGEPVYQADTITTFAAAEVHVSMADGAELAVRENTKVTITVYVANGDDDDRSLLDLARGTLRAVTGWIGKYRRSGYQIRTPMVTIGVRGTDHEPTHIPPGDPRGEPGSYDKVNEGSTVMQSDLGTVEVTPNRAAHFDAARKVPPRLLQTVPAFFKPGRHEERFVQRARESVRTLDTQREQRRQLIQKHPEFRHTAAVATQRRLEQKAARQDPRPARPALKAEAAQKKGERVQKLRERVEKKRSEAAASPKRESPRKTLQEKRERLEKKRFEKKRE
jgi:FecR protein